MPCVAALVADRDAVDCWRRHLRRVVWRPRQHASRRQSAEHNPTPFGSPTNPPNPTPTPTSPVPEPATLMLLGTGLAFLARKRVKRA